MALLQVRNFPDDIYSKLLAFAQNEHRSVSQQTIVLIKSSLESEYPKKTLRIDLLANMLEEEPIDTDGFPSPEELIREDRDR